jgi:DNA-binding MarR family transcriptional regulator
VNRHRRGLVAKLMKSLVTAGLARTRYEAAFILCTVEANPFPADLARALSMPKPSMTFLIKKLEESGYLRRQGEKGDLRRYRLTITPSGIKARDRGAEVVNRIFGACLSSLSAADQATLNPIIDQVQPRTSKTAAGGALRFIELSSLPFAGYGCGQRKTSIKLSRRAASSMGKPRRSDFEMAAWEFANSLRRCSRTRGCAARLRRTHARPS